VVAVLTGNVLKDPDYIYRYHTGALEAPDGTRIMRELREFPIVVPNDPDRIGRIIEQLTLVPSNKWYSYPAFILRLVAESPVEMP